MSIPPQSYFVRQIAGDTLEINELIPPNTDEHNFDFKPSTMQRLEKSDIYFTIGLEFEKPMLYKFKNMFKHLKIIDTREGIKPLYTSFSHSHDDEKHEAHEHETHSSHEAELAYTSTPQNDPHIWLDPILVKTQAQNIAKALIATYPSHAALYRANLQSFLSELDALDARIKAILKDKKGQKLIVYHPSWAYFAARYELVQVPVEIEGKKILDSSLATQSQNDKIPSSSF